jgi:EmrB/QacA subfamily drug resistance transporter
VATKSQTSKGMILLLTCAAQFMVVLDIAIVNVALPTIQRDLGIGQGSLQWIVVAYSLMLGGFLLLGGRLADHLGRRRVLLAGLILFSAASLLAGVSGSAGLLIGARALQGLGAALLPPTALSILAVTFDEGAERNKALGIYGAVTGISASVGVIASGLLTSGPGWRWIFFINVPIGVALVALAVVFLPADARDLRRERRERFDAGGAVTVTGGLLLLVYALNRGAEHGWGSWPTIGLFAGSAVLLCAFTAIEARSRSPLVPASAVRNRRLVAANLSSFFVFGALLAFIFLGTLLMQQVLGYSPTRTGVAWLATTAMSFVAAAVTGAKLAAVVGVRRLLIAGLALLAVAGLLLTRIPAGGHYATSLLPAFLLAGLGGGMSAPAVQIAALSEVAPALTGVASGLLETMREIAGAITIAIVSTVLISRAGGVGGTAGSLNAFHAAFWVIFAVGALGAITAAITFQWRASRDPEPEFEPGPAAAHGPAVHEPAAEPG